MAEVGADLDIGVQKKHVLVESAQTEAAAVMKGTERHLEAAIASSDISLRYPEKLILVRVYL